MTRAAMTRAALAQPRLAVLWSVAVARLVLAAAAALSAPSLLLELAPEGGLSVGEGGEPLTGPRSWAAAAALVVLWLALELFARTDPRWRSWAGRRRRLSGEHLQPGLATVPLAFATGASAGLAASTAGHLLVGGDDFVAAGVATSLAPTTAEVLAFALLTGYLLVVASPLSAGRTVCAAGAAGLAAGLASSYLSVLSSAVLTITAWPLLLLVVSLLVVLRPLDDARRRLRSWSTGVARRWGTGRRDDTSGLRAAAPLRGAPATRR